MASHDDDTDLFMSVKFDGGGRVCNVVVTSQTTGEDVVECLKPDDDKVYYLVEIWKGCERPIGNEENLQSVLLQWGSDLDDVTFVLKRKHASSRQNQKKKPAKSSRDSPVDSQDHVHEQQLKVENMQRVLEEKEQYLKSLRANKVPLKNGLKTNYVRRLELKVLEQEEQLGSMQSLEEDSFKYQVDNERLILELHRLRSLFAMKHQQLSEATARVEVLTKQLALQSPIQSDMNGNTVGVPGEEMPRDQEKNNAVQNSELQRQRNVVGQNDRQLDSLKTHLSREQGPRLTEAQISRQNTNLLRSNASIHTTKRSESAGDGGVILGHVNSKERESWDDDDENDTETSQDSGHVSVDSPSYQRGGMDPSFKFHSRNPPGRYIEKIECFDMDQEFRITTTASLNVIKDLHGSSVVDGLPYSSLSRNKNRSVKNIVSHACNPNSSQPNCKAALSVQTDEKQCVLISAQFSQTQSKLDSPQSTLSSRSSMASQLSDAEMRSDEARTASRKTNAKEPLTYTTTPLTRKETKIDVRETSIDRTLGSISHYQRNKGDSPTEKDNLTARATDSKVGAAGGDVKPDEKPKTGLYRQPIQSAGVQSLNTRDAKPLQIQTRAEKDSGNQRRASSPGLSRDVGQTVDGKQQKDAKLAPKPLPRKRTKTPPARSSSDDVANIVVTSARTINELSASLPEHSTVDNDEPRGNTRAAGFLDKKEANESGKSGEVQGSSERGRNGIRVGESSLKKETGKGSKKSGKRVSLDPHAVLLHASLEGELDLVKTIIHQVEDPSFPNTEGLTALHHAVCSSHDGIVKFLVGYGCDINASDMQGWTSLHCAAANNSMTLCEFLITRGACIFATTAIESKTPSLCCEKDVQDFEECLSYLLDSESNFGVTNDGVVYAVYGYQASRKDELSFECGERLTVIRRGDVTEKEWWWARDSRGQLGYIPRNLLALHPRIAPDV